MMRNNNIDENMTAEFMLTMILGVPILFGIVIIALPFEIIAVLIGVPLKVLLKNLLAFGIAVFIVWLFSKYHIIEDGIVGLTVGILIHTHFKWHPVFCILAGLAVMGLLFFFSSLKIGFWIKTLLFSLIITTIVFVIFYSGYGLFPLPDKIWKISFFIVFMLENLYIRYANSGLNPTLEAL